MSGFNAAVPSSPSRRDRVVRGRVRTIEYRRRAAVALEVPESGFARYVGRVGALAVALGVGAAVAAVPVAFADTTGSSGSSGSSDSSASNGA